ncbi:P-loop containing nucleoside triphosphate hydrolase protein [Sanghuangporus baumii]|uniref:P-loop containing nucleoside triphosphate hydrolase protein n=1 Tax=Sanghuangporus baumii TaxID=108892 RepID=A0A9Q5I415_SANBA|nr:P-loop containing nucleoside triphosphate hydrolase protein [Sanghuangporus baumii]
MASPRSAELLTSQTKLLQSLAHRVRLLQTVLGLPGAYILQMLKSLVPKLLANPQVREILRFVFLGSVVELTRSVSQKAADYVKHFFVVKASFTRGDFAFDWVKRYLEDHRIWDESRVFQVGACNPALRDRKSAGLGEEVQSDNAQASDDGRPHPIYQPAPQEPELFRWRGRWISVSISISSSSGFNKDPIQVLTLSVWSRKRKILDDFVQEARNHYFESPVPPRELTNLPDESGSTLTARFYQGDSSYDWIVAFVNAQETTEDTTDLEVTTKQSDLYNPSNHPSERPVVGFKPAPRVRQRLKWGNHWVQVDVDSNAVMARGRSAGGSITITIHNSKRSVLKDFIMATREEYLKTTVSKVTVHLSNHGAWMNGVTKKRRSLNTLILPEGAKEELLRDMREFLGSEEWYVWAGVPHRRGYLLYGKPGTGKSSTIHALASELELKIYFIQLSSQGLDDYQLSSLVSSAPSRCILLLEDIDCAFPSREEDDDLEDKKTTDAFGNTIIRYPQSRVTLSGLLNVLDSVTSEEGRITFATTNHIERLDPALIRAGRMDVKVEYKFATRYQIQETYLRFFERRFVSSDEHTNLDVNPSVLVPPPRPALSGLHSDEPPLSEGEVRSLAQHFADAIPEDMFALAQIQGYLLTKKMEPRGAVDGAPDWVEKEIEGKRKLEELKEKRRQQRKEMKAAAPAAQANLPIPIQVPPVRISPAPFGRGGVLHYD